MNEFQHGPFAFEPTGKPVTLNGTASQRWVMSYACKQLHESVLPVDATRAQIIDAFDECRAQFVRDRNPARSGHPSPLAHGYMVRLYESAAATGVKGREIDSFLCLAPIEGMASTIIDDREPTWLIDDKYGFCTPMGMREFARLKEAHEAIAMALTSTVPAAIRPAALAWLAGVLPEDVMTTDPQEWRSPTAWEIRHVVGEGSFSGLSGAKAAALVGVTPQNFRKYTAADGASTRQRMSFAMWHLLLLRIGVVSCIQ